MAIASSRSDDGDAPFPVLQIPSNVSAPEEVVRFLLAHHEGVPEDQKEIALEARMYRESLGSTNVGSGVAFPELVAPWVTASQVVAGQLSKSLPWPGDEPVRYVFLIVAQDHEATFPLVETIATYLRIVE